MPKSTHFIQWFEHIEKDDASLVGEKGAHLGDMAQAGFPVPPGFAITSRAYYRFIRDNNLTTKIKHLLGTANFTQPESVLQVSTHIKKLIMEGDLHEDIVKDIFKAYTHMSAVLNDAFVAVRASVTTEQLFHVSFVGQEETFLHIQGEANLLLKVKTAWASMFEAKAIFYRHEKKIDHFRVGMAILVQKMVTADSAGILFTIDPVTNDTSSIVIEAVLGLGELIVQGQVTPDQYAVDKKVDTIIQKEIAMQTIKLERHGLKNKLVSIPSKEGKQQKITDKQILALAQLGKKLEKHTYYPQEVEWAFEKETLYLIHTRQITPIHTKKLQIQPATESSKLPILSNGKPMSPGIVSGPVRPLRTVKDASMVSPGDIVIVGQTNTAFLPMMRKAGGIIMQTGGHTSHAATVSRALGIPAVIATEHITSTMKPGMIVTLDGKTGTIYKGGLGNSTPLITYTQQTVLPPIKTATKVYVSFAQPDIALQVVTPNVDGIGLLRAEYMMSVLGIHPKQMIHDGKKQIYITMLAEQIATVCHVFDARPVLYRASDFKTNEYRGLLGGKHYEPTEANPLLGYRGAYRYTHDPEIFELELEAIKIVRNKMGLKNLWLVLPFVRTVKELVDVKRIISGAGLYRSPSFKLWMMIDVPANVILLDKFISVGIDGVSIGSDTLTTLLLGTDKDNSEVAPAFDEQNEALLWAYEHVIKTAQKHKITSSICGQAVSLYPDLVEKLVTWGISSISVTPDVIDQTRTRIANTERTLMK